MDSLHNLVVKGTVLYLVSSLAVYLIQVSVLTVNQGISDAPAWLVVKANSYAKANGKTPFVIYQAPYSVVQRDLEREILQMCIHEGKS